MRDEALYWDIPHPTSDGQCTMYDGGCKIRGASIFRNMTSYFLIPFLFFVCSFCFAAVQKTQLSSQLSPYGQYIYAKRVFCASFKQKLPRRATCHNAACTPSAGCPPPPAPRQPACHAPSSVSHWVSRLPPYGFSLKHKKPRSQAQETTLIKWSQTLP